MSDLDRVRESGYTFYIGRFRFTMYTDKIHGDGREYIYVRDETGLVIRDFMKGYLTIQAAKDAMERDVRDFVRELNKDLKTIKSNRKKLIEGEK